MSMYICMASRVKVGQVQITQSKFHTRILKFISIHSIYICLPICHYKQKPFLFPNPLLNQPRNKTKQNGRKCISKNFNALQLHTLCGLTRSSRICNHHQVPISKPQRNQHDLLHARLGDRPQRHCKSRSKGFPKVRGGCLASEPCKPATTS